MTATRQPRGVSWSRLATLVRLAPTATAVAGGLMVIANGAALAIPAAAATAVNAVIAATDVTVPVLVLTGLLLLCTTAEALGGPAQIHTVTAVTASLRGRLIRHVFGLGVSGARGYSTGDLVSRFTGNAAVTATAVPALVTASVQTIVALGGVVALFVIDWWLGVAFLVCALPAVLLLAARMGTVTDRYGEYLERLAAIVSRLTDAVAGARTIHASGTAGRETERILRPLPQLAAAGRATWETQRGISWRLDTVTLGVQLVVIAVAGWGVATERLTAGDIVAAVLYLTIALGVIAQVDTLIRLSEARANAHRVFQVLDETPAAPAPSPGVTPGAAGGVEFDDVTVVVDGETVVDGVSFTVPQGQTVAMVGRSGAGKSTLALLVGRLLDPDRGRVLVAGVPVTELSHGTLRQLVGYAFDRPVLAGETIRQALTFGRPGSTDTEVAGALAAAHASDFVARLPDGVHTRLVGIRFSGGELQRLGIARALLRRATVLVLDDATSHLDTATEARVDQAVASRAPGQTRLVVAHRAATAQRADLVAWLDDSTLRAIGTHAHLWQTEPGYRAVFTATAVTP